LNPSRQKVHQGTPHSAAGRKKKNGPVVRTVHPAKLANEGRQQPDKKEKTPIQVMGGKSEEVKKESRAVTTRVGKWRNVVVKKK